MSHDRLVSMLADCISTGNVLSLFDFSDFSPTHLNCSVSAGLAEIVSHNDYANLIGYAKDTIKMIDFRCSQCCL